VSFDQDPMDSVSINFRLKNQTIQKKLKILDLKFTNRARGWRGTGATHGVLLEVDEPVGEAPVRRCKSPRLLLLARALSRHGSNRCRASR
jgi:hypothetical protein